MTRASTSSTQLKLTLQTTCSDGGNGAVALRDGKIVGLLMGTHRSRQEGTLLALETIRHYLDDFEDGTYHGCPAPSMYPQLMLRDDLRDFYGMGKERHGMLITRVMHGRTGHGVVQDGDVLLKLDGYDIDDESKFTHEVHGRLNASWLFQGRRYPGDKVKATVLRGGKEQEVEFELRGAPESEKSIPDGPGKERPQFMVVGGLVIFELNKRLAGTIGRTPGGVLLRRFNDRAGWDPPTERHRMAYVDRVYQDPSNKGFEWLRQTPIKSVNGRPINRIADVAKALEKPEGKFHVFRFDGVASDYVVVADQLEAINERIAKTYRISRLRYLKGDPK